MYYKKLLGRGDVQAFFFFEVLKNQESFFEYGALIFTDAAFFTLHNPGFAPLPAKITEER